MEVFLNVKAPVSKPIVAWEVLQTLSTNHIRLQNLTRKSACLFLNFFCWAIIRWPNESNSEISVLLNLGGHSQIDFNLS